MKKSFAKFLHVFLMVSMVVWSMAPGLGAFINTANASPVPYVTTDPATGMTMTDATLHGTNVSNTATGHSFWVSTTSSINTSNPLSIPVGVYSTPDLGGIPASTSFSALLSSATGLPAITSNTPYYFVAWSLVDGTWHPGSELSFSTTAYVTTNAATGMTTTDATLHGTANASVDNTSFWWGTSPAGPFTPEADPSSQLVGDWTHDTGLGAKLSGDPFSYPLSGLTPSTQYYFVAWGQVGGIWYPDTILNFTTAPVTSIVDVYNLQPNWSAVGGGGVFSAYVGPPAYGYVSPGTTTLFDEREAGIIKAGFNTAPANDEGLFGFIPNVTINTLAGGPLTYDVETQFGVNPVWMTIEIDTGVVGDRSDNTIYQFVPTTNPTGWHLVDASAGLWQKWNNGAGDTTGNPLISLSAVVTAHTGLNVVRAYLRLGMGDSYYNGGTGTTAWVDKATIGDTTYDFVLAPSTPAVSPATINLGNAGNFAVLSKVAISSVPTSIITGDIGVSPVSGTAITGFTCPNPVTGTVHVASAGGDTLGCQTVDPESLTPTILEMEAAYTDANSRTPDVTMDGDIGGETLVPGVYFTAGSLGISTDVTLDCSADANGVFIFQIGGNLTLAASTDVLIGSCQPGNIFWAVAGTTNIGGGVGAESTFVGTVLGGPDTSEITVITGSTVNGRLLGQKTVALDQNTVSIPPSTTGGNGTIKITKYACPDGATITRGTNGPSATNIDNVDYAIPEGCVPEAGAHMGYTYDSSNSTSNTGPYKGLNDDPLSPFIPFSLTDGSGVATLNDALTPGRYIVAELNSDGHQLASDQMLGMYCYGDGDTTGVNDNQELTFSVAGKVSNCVVYNKMPPAPTTPTLLGWNVQSEAASLESNPISLACQTGGVSINDSRNSLNQRWTSVDGSNVKYIRRVSSDVGVNWNVLSGMVFTTPSMNGWFSFGAGEQGTYQTEVMAFNDINNDGIANDGPLSQSGWSNDCPITYDTTPPIVTVVPVAGSELSGTVQFTITVTDNNPLDLTKLTNIFTYLYNSAPPQKNHGENVDLSSGSGTFTVDTNQLDNGDAWLDVGQLYDAAGNPSGPADNYFKNYTITNEAPVITAQAFSAPTDTSMTITWTTDHLATSRVVYDTVSHPGTDPAPNYGYAFSTVEDPTLTLGHSVLVSGLTPGTTYYFRAVSHGSPEAVGDEISGSTTGGTGTIEITKYDCPDGTTVTRSANGVGVSDGVPAGCVLSSGKTFGYVHGDQTDANFPHPELAGPFLPGGATVGGILDISGLASAGRYLIAETNNDGQQLPAGDILGLYCEGDGDTSGTNDNQELTFVPADGIVHCVAYNKMVATPPTTGHIIVTKVTDPANDDTTFSLTAQTRDGSITGESNQNISAAGEPVDYEVTPGTYRVGELAHEGWTQTGNTCLGLEVVAGETVNCTLTNTKQVETPTTGTIEITKYECPADTSINRNDSGVEGTPPHGCSLQSGANFSYAHGTQTNGEGPWDDFNNPLTVGGTTGDNGVLTIPDLSPDGRYIVFETNTDNNKLADGDILGLYCDGDADPTPTHNDNGDIALVHAGEITQCVAYNKMVTPTTGTLIVKKVVVNDNNGTDTANDFSFQVNQEETIPFTQDGEIPLHGENHLTLSPGAYSVTEPTAEGYTTTYDGCDGIDLLAGGTATCTITNDDIAPLLTFNRVSGGGGGGGGGGCTAGTSFNFALGRCVPNGGGQVLGASTGPIDGCGNRTTGFSVTTGQSCIGNNGTGQVLGADKFIFTLLLQQTTPPPYPTTPPAYINEVTELQKFLNAAGDGPLVVDGKFGPLTKAAVIKFQLAHGLVGDGIVGPLTRALLNK